MLDPGKLRETKRIWTVKRATRTDPIDLGYDTKGQAQFGELVLAILLLQFKDLALFDLKDYSFKELALFDLKDLSQGWSSKTDNENLRS